MSKHVEKNTPLLPFHFHKMDLIEPDNITTRRCVISNFFDFYSNCVSLNTLYITPCCFSPLRINSLPGFLTNADVIYVQPWAICGQSNARLQCSLCINRDVLICRSNTYSLHWSGPTYSLNRCVCFVLTFTNCLRQWSGNYLQRGRLNTVNYSCSFYLRANEKCLILFCGTIAR